VKRYWRISYLGILLALPAMLLGIIPGAALLLLGLVLAVALHPAVDSTGAARCLPTCRGDNGPTPGTGKAT
jgi:hypothetical protein